MIVVALVAGSEGRGMSAHPHHKHVRPDIKHHRVPAPGLSFQAPNLPFLIREVEREHLVR